MKNASAKLLVLLLSLGMHALATAQSPTRAVPLKVKAAAVDVGELKSLSGDVPMSVTIALRLRDIDGAEKLLKAQQTPGDPSYHQFLTSREFAARFAPSEVDVATVSSALAAYGLKVDRTSATTLKATGLPGDMERAFSVKLHRYVVAAKDEPGGYSFHAPVGRAVVPAEISKLVAGVAGLDSGPHYRPHRVVGGPAHGRVHPSAKPVAANASGLLTVRDFANLYDVTPLYRQGVTGTGRTIGIMSLAGFTPSDAFAYWSDLGLSVDPNRITIVNVDGGPGAPDDRAGSDETTLDVEQAGGIAPDAKIIVYLAPNSNQSFVDVFAAAIEANQADTLSISWGSWEWLNNADNGPVIDPTSGHLVSTTQAVHELLVRAALQGQSVFAASGDAGAYDANDSLGCLPSTSPSCNTPLAVDYPASDPAITAGGGTTLPGFQEFCLDEACAQIFTVKVTHERVWSWDYLQPLCNALGVPDPVDCGIFPGGGGGGVSILFPVPDYQLQTSGVQRSQRGQTLVYDGQFIFSLPSDYAGRNLPDVSFNADPETGYVVYYTSSTQGFQQFSFYGGTSFVAPQLNGVSALLGQYLGGQRLGLLNYPLYSLARSSKAFDGVGAFVHAIKFGTNWFYTGSNGYNPGAGLGTLDVANFAAALRGSF